MYFLQSISRDGCLYQVSFSVSSPHLVYINALPMSPVQVTHITHTLTTHTHQSMRPKTSSEQTLWGRNSGQREREREREHKAKDIKKERRIKCSFHNQSVVSQRKRIKMRESEQFSSTTQPINEHKTIKPLSQATF